MIVWGKLVNTLWIYIEKKNVIIISVNFLVFTLVIFFLLFNAVEQPCDGVNTGTKHCINCT